MSYNKVIKKNSLTFSTMLHPSKNNKILNKFLN